MDADDFDQLNQCHVCGEFKLDEGFGLAGGGYGSYVWCGCCGYFRKWLLDDDEEVIGEVLEMPSRRQIHKGRVRVGLLEARAQRCKYPHDYARPF